MVPIRYWRMALGNITPKASDRDVEVQKVAPRFKRNSQNQPTDELEGYNLSFLALKGCDQICKLPLSAKKEVEEIQKLLADGQAIVRVKLINAVLKAYALKSNTTGELLTGISMSADSLEVTSVEKPEVDDDLEKYESLNESVQTVAVSGLSADVVINVVIKYHRLPTGVDSSWEPTAIVPYSSIVLWFSQSHSGVVYSDCLCHN